MTLTELEEAKTQAVEAHLDAENKVLGLVLAVKDSHRAGSDAVPRLVEMLCEADDLRAVAFDAIQAARQAVIDAYHAAMAKAG